ncbi:MAG: peptide deformylase [Oscillospiraceae bacterium]|nr:peptide deformylase [Oscillospiraceae bacterium]
MAIRNILSDEDTALYKTSRNVTDFGSRLHTLIDDMRETLLDANGIGLAAPQVGVLRRVALIIDTSRESDEDANTRPGDNIIELINPVFLHQEGEESSSEGCLSVPGVYGIVMRPQAVKIKAQDRYGNEYELDAAGLTARAICHEIDHLNGVLFTSVAERILTDEEVEEMSKSEQQEEEEHRI